MKSYTLSSARVTQLIENYEGSVSKFLRENDINPSTYYRWVSGEARAPFDFYALLTTKFGGNPMDYAVEVTAP
jgi:hypothetical protein